MTYPCYQIHCEMPNNINICVHVRGKTMWFIYISLPITSHARNKNLKMKLIHFQKNTSMHKNFFFQSLKYLKENEDMSFFEFLDF